MAFVDLTNHLVSLRSTPRHWSFTLSTDDAISKSLRTIPINILPLFLDCHMPYILFALRTFIHSIATRYHVFTVNRSCRRLERPFLTSPVLETGLSTSFNYPPMSSRPMKCLHSFYKHDLLQQASHSFETYIGIALGRVEPGARDNGAVCGVLDDVADHLAFRGGEIAECGWTIEGIKTKDWVRFGS